MIIFVFQGLGDAIMYTNVLEKKQYSKCIENLVNKMKM